MKENVRNSNYLSYLTRQAPVMYKDNDRATEKSDTKGAADRFKSKKAASLVLFATLKE